MQMMCGHSIVDKKTENEKEQEKVPEQCKVLPTKLEKLKTVTLFARFDTVFIEVCTFSRQVSFRRRFFSVDVVIVDFAVS